MDILVGILVVVVGSIGEGKILLIFVMFGEVFVLVNLSVVIRGIVVYVF